MISILDFLPVNLANAIQKGLLTSPVMQKGNVHVKQAILVENVINVKVDTIRTVLEHVLKFVQTSFAVPICTLIE